MLSRSTGLSPEDLLVGYFGATPEKKALLDRVHRRVCGNMAAVQDRTSTMARLRAMHSPLQLIQLLLDMGATKSGYRSLVSF